MKWEGLRGKHPDGWILCIKWTKKNGSLGKY